VTRAAAAALAVVALAGYGGAKDSRRGDVNDYIARVNAVARDAAAPWTKARKAYLAVGRGAITSRELRTLAAAPATIRSLRARIAAVTPPDEAKRLHAALLRLLDMDARFAEEVTLFARYVRAVGPIEKRLRADTAYLRTALKQSRVSAAQQRALTAYAKRLSGLVAQLGRLRPPAALAPWHDEQTARIVTLRKGARDVTDGLAHGDAALARRGLDALTGSATSSTVTAADRRAVVAYNARLKRIRAAAATVAREHERLARELT